MKYVFFNPQACGGKAVQKWKEFIHDSSELAGAKIIDDFHKLEWKSLKFEAGDSLISAGGDGTLHCMVNGLIQHKGLESLNTVKVGHIGLGSNNSFLRPYTDKKKSGSIPYTMGEKTYQQDLISIQIDGNKTVYCVANSSMGFLARANEIFNTSSGVTKLKSLNSDVADVYTFLKALVSWRPIELQLETNGQNLKKTFTNLHFMKKPFYAADLGFPETIVGDSGQFACNQLYGRSKLQLLGIFIKLMLFNQSERGRDQMTLEKNIRVKSEFQVPIEVDGEIYWGKEFLISVLQGKIHLCQ